MMQTHFKNTIENIFSKKTILLISSIILFFFYQSKIIFFINKYFVTKNTFSNNILDWLIIVFSCLVTLYMLFKITFHNYHPSFSQKLTICSIIFLIIYFKIIEDQTPWQNSIDSVFYLEYFTYILIPLVSSLFFYILIRIFIRIESIFPSSRFLIKPSVNIYLNDDSILNKDDDILDYQPKIDSLKSILLYESYIKSISIGLVGPWGNGKSSFINMTQKQINEKAKDYLIMIHFLPYLNHKEDDIINEFFISLSKELTKYSGKLSSQILDYAKKLTEIYKGNNVFDLFSKHISNINSIPAKELYDDINSRLKEIDKKIIVFVDDLDRLSGKEIIQVLKLIRNTADFTNTIFVVAMDKDYVINRLKSENNISSTRFVDKFFQLEIYLPEIDKTILKDYVFNKLKHSILNNSSDFEIKLLKGLNHDDNLFEDFIKNLRDAKRLVNQIIFDYKFLRDEINFKDFFNFTYFKLKFPKFIELLNHNRLDFLKVENEEYKLNKVPEKDNRSKVMPQFKIKDFLVFNSVKYNDYSYLNKYTITDSLLPSDDCLKSILNIDCEDVLLLSKILAYLFGEENKVDSFNSIKKENNFNMLMQQRIFKEILLESEFQQLINENDENRSNNILESLYSENKLVQLFSRLDYYSSNDEKLLRNIILILFRIYEKRIGYDINEHQLLHKMDVFVERFIGKNDEVNVEWISKELLEKNVLSSESKLSILCELFDSKVDNKLWHIKEEKITIKALTLFKEFLENKKDKLWEVNDFSFYKYYHQLKSNIELKEDLNKVIRNFWKENDIELLCVQSTDLPSFSLSSFKISDVVVEIFDTKSQFHEFVKKHSDNPSDAVNEFLEVYKLYGITGYGLPIIYNFKYSKLMINKININKNTYGRSSYNKVEKHIQIIFETNFKPLISEIVQLRTSKTTKYTNVDISYQKLDLLQFSVFASDGKHYLFLSYDKKYELNYGIETLKAFEVISIAMFSQSQNNFKDLKNKLANKQEIVIKDEIYVKSISIQKSQSTI